MDEEKDMETWEDGSVPITLKYFMNCRKPLTAIWRLSTFLGDKKLEGM